VVDHFSRLGATLIATRHYRVAQSVRLDSRGGRRQHLDATQTTFATTYPLGMDRRSQPGLEACRTTWHQTRLVGRRQNRDQGRGTARSDLAKIDIRHQGSRALSRGRHSRKRHLRGAETGCVSLGADAARAAVLTAGLSGKLGPNCVAKARNRRVTRASRKSPRPCHESRDSRGADGREGRRPLEARAPTMPCQTDAQPSDEDKRNREAGRPKALATGGRRLLGDGVVTAINERFGGRDVRPPCSG